MARVEIGDLAEASNGVTAQLLQALEGTEPVWRAFCRFLEIANRHAEMAPLLEEFVAELKDLTGCNAVGLRILDGKGNIPYQAYQGFSQSFYESESPLSIKSDRCMCIYVIEGNIDPTLPFYTEGGSFYANGTMRLLATVSEEEKGQTRNVCNQVGYESVALVPIRPGNRVLGLIHVADRRENMVPLEMVELLEEIGKQLGTAIQRVRAEEDLQQLNRELVLLNGDLALFNRASQAFSSTLDLDQVLTTVLEEIRHLMDVVACSIWLIDDETGELACQQATGPLSRTVRGWRLPPGEGLAGWAVRHSESLIVPDAQSDERHFRDVEQQIGMTLRSVLTVPLRVKQGVIGVLQVVDTEVDRFDANDLGSLEPLAASAAIAIENARLYEQAQREIAERKRAEGALLEQTHALRQERNFAESLIETAQAIVLVLDTAGRIVRFNLYMEEISGYQLEEVQGQDWFTTLLPKRDHERIRELFSQAISDIQTHGNVNPIVTKDGREREIEWYDKTLKDAAGNVVGLLAVGQDITERVRAEEALRHQAFLLENVSDAIISSDMNFNIQSWNRAAEEIYDWRADEVIGKSVGDALQPEYPYDQREQVIEQFLADGYWKGEVIHRRKDGTAVHILGSVTLLKDDEGNPIGVVSANRDITERVRAEEEQERLLAQIREQAQRVRQIIDTVPEGVLLLDADRDANGRTHWRIILANPLGKKDLVTLADARVGDTLAHLGDRPLTELLTSPPKGLWHEVTTSTRIFEVMARPLVTGPGPQGWVLVIRDMTQGREVQRRAQQQERLAAVGQLAAGIAHDFNNIMTTIILYAQALSRIPELSPRHREQLGTINQQAEHATSLIQQILDFSRRAVLERRPMDLLVFLKEQVKMLERTLPESIEIELVYGPGEHTVNADPTRMQQAIMNLATNARDAMPEGGQLRIHLERIEGLPSAAFDPDEGRAQDRRGEETPRARQGGQQWVRVTVADTGTGVPPDVLPHIFDPFFTTKALSQGTGLGLAQVYGIVKQHEGHVDVSTEMGKGTTFTLYLPVLPVHEAGTTVQKAEHLIQGQGQTILVVEDNAVTRQALVNSLEMLNYRVLEAANGLEALAVLEQSPPSSPPMGGKEGGIALVLSDMVMPEMGGQALFQTLRQRDSTTKVVLMTGHPLEEELGGLQAQGLSGWLLKPPRLEQLAQVVRQVLAQE